MLCLSKLPDVGLRVVTIKPSPSTRKDQWHSQGTEPWFYNSIEGISKGKWAKSVSLATLACKFRFWTIDLSQKLCHWHACKCLWKRQNW